MNAPYLGMIRGRAHQLMATHPAPGRDVAGRRGVVGQDAQHRPDRELGQAFFASALVSLVISATFDALSFPMFAGMFFLTIAAGGSYLGFIRRAAPQPPTVESPCPPQTQTTRIPVP